MDEYGNHHSQQIYTRTENQTPHVLTHRQVLNNENIWTRGGSVRGEWGGTAGVGSLGGITWGEMPDTGEGVGGSKLHSHICIYATILHILHMYPRN